jgi:hypothetical protein
MKSLIKIVTAIALILFVGNFAYAAGDPVGVLFQSKGKVEYSKNGTKWRKVRRNKFLFAGYQIRTGDDSSAKVTIKATGKNLEIGANALITVNDKGLVAKNGQLAESENSDRLVAGLMNKFQKSQSYTTVRRSHKKKKANIRIARSVTLSDDYPCLVWNNVGEDYNYKLVVGDDTYDVAAADDDIVRIKLNPFTGEKAVKIDVLKEGKVVTSLKPYQRKGKPMDHVVKWMDDSEKTEFENTVKEIQSTYGEDSFMLGSYFEKNDMWVAAMDQYKLYLEENPDELEMTPYLFRIYKKLYLEDIYKNELEKWKAATLE